MHHSCSLPHNKHNMRQTNTTINSWYNNCLCAVWHVYLYSLTLHRWWLSSSDSYKRQLRSWSPEQQFTLQWLYRRPRSSVCLLLHHQYFTCKTKKNVNHRWIIKYPWTSYRVVQDFLHHCSSHLVHSAVSCHHYWTSLYQPFGFSKHWSPPDFIT